MTEPEKPSTDPTVAFVSLVKDHLKFKPIQEYSKFLLSDQGQGFWRAPFSSTHGRWDIDGGLAEATLLGYRAFRFLEKTAEQLYTKVDLDRMTGLYLSLVTARWCDLRTMAPVFDQKNRASITSTSVANAVSMGIDLRPVEVQALTGWFLSRLEMVENHEGFTPEWWIISETMSWLYVANRG